ncbi:hypothetical protein PC116_g5691 [Phytophthora cactorum]|uniref:Uncharacterized protein n=1 Tax=Phytophthora cactorum TaxID=29920 RepID=A0A8T1CXM8_9STRA|nr:hypothetical protein Pcac1_g24363 [Phytophthora cactorum]KAG2930875.1 hypothetical protein PC117_g13635 [Phytophthora cactorum]KAG3007224.1 hypothetical protein PC119_g14666 [Phytophthora cactorum]KAG3013098.1 hypothetical protein PC120_g13458 [Phytophthora cactorum]KAG3170199.1 hypothetical protein C6341_g10878 [Phytophthora cactorum]
MISQVLRSEARLRRLSKDCLSRRSAPPRFQLQLDQAVVEFVMHCEDMQLALTGSMIIARAKWILHRMGLPSPL